MKKNVLWCLIACAIVSSPVIAADKPTTAKAQTTKKTTGNSSVDISNGTDVIGSQDAPMVLNVVSWKDKENYLPKNPLSVSILQESIDPIDRDVVHREVDFSHALQQTTTP